MQRSAPQPPLPLSSSRWCWVPPHLTSHEIVRPQVQHLRQTARNLGYLRRPHEPRINSLPPPLATRHRSLSPPCSPGCDGKHVLAKALAHRWPAQLHLLNGSNDAIMELPAASLLHQDPCLTPACNALFPPPTRSFRLLPRLLIDGASLHSLRSWTAPFADDSRLLL